ncbi:MAG: hypothetical protein K0Q70_810 [Rhodospirillales bacterium]|jgi:hypothetical protein|nr:hypothetical protein [Rhodospirillales bacterium]
MRRSDIISAGLFFVLGFLTIFAIIPIYVDGSARGGDLSPAFMPYVAAAIGTVAAGLLLIVRLMRKDIEDEPNPVPKGSWYFIAVASLVLGVTFLLMDIFGYLLGAAAIVAGFMALARADLKVIVGTAIVFPVSLWLLFDKLLGFPLP